MLPIVGKDIDGTRVSIYNASVQAKHPLLGLRFKNTSGAHLNQGPITLSAIFLAIFLQVFLFRSRWGLRTRAVGEHPKAAETVGIDVIRLRYRNVILGGIFAGLAGAWFTLDFGNSFQAGMTNGRGYIALAALIFGKWHPLGVLGATLLFGAFEAAAAGVLAHARAGIAAGERLGANHTVAGDVIDAIPAGFRR